MSALLTLHLCAVAFWFGVVGAEFVIERSRAESRLHGFAVARNHYWIDLTLEMPAYVTVAASGLLLLGRVELSALLSVKVVAGLIAVGVNALCLLPVWRRKLAADAGNLTEVIRYSTFIDRITWIGLPTGFIALILGVFLNSKGALA